MASQQGFETLAIHAGQEPDPVTGAVVPPIYQVSTYKQDGVGGLRGGYEYSRSANPTRTALERCLAALETGARGGSGPPPQAARPAGSSPPEPAQTSPTRASPTRSGGCGRRTGWPT